MGYIIEITTKNAIWDNIKAWGPPVFTLLLGLFIGSCLDWWRRRREVQNIRSMIYREVKGIQVLAYAFSKEQIRTIAAGINHFTTTPVYDNYLGRLYILRKAELTKLYELNHELRVFNKDTQEIRNKVLEGGKSFTKGEEEMVTYAVSKIIEYTTAAIKAMDPYIRDKIEFTQADIAGDPSTRG